MLVACFSILVVVERFLIWGEEGKGGGMMCKVNGQSSASNSLLNIDAEAVWWKCCPSFIKSAVPSVLVHIVAKCLYAAVMGSVLTAL